MHGQITGSPLEEGSGYVRVREALRTLALNKWIEIDQTVGELRIRLGERARALNTLPVAIPPKGRSRSGQAWVPAQGRPLLTTKLTVAPLTSWPIETSGRWRSTVPARRLECTRLTEPREYPASLIRAFATLS